MSDQPDPKPTPCPYCQGKGGYESGSKKKGMYAKCLACGGTGNKEEKP